MAPKILIGTQSVTPAFGGPAVSVVQIARGLAALGSSVSVLSADGSRLPEFHEGQLGLDCQYAVVRSFGLWSWLNHRVCRWARRRQAPLVISPLGMLEPWALRQKRIKKWFAWCAYQRRDLSLATAVHATSEAEANAIRDLGVSQPIAVIPHGVELPPLSASDRRRARASGAAVKTALFLSRIHPKKGLPLLIEAWSRVRPTNWRLVIAGPGEEDYRKHIAALVQQFQLAEVVTIKDGTFGEEKEAQWREAELMVLPSHSENFGIVVAEAQARSIPVITTTATPWRDISENGSGWWIAPSVDAIEGALRDATGLPDNVRMEMGVRGRRLMETRYSWDAAVSRHMILHNWCITRGKPPEFLQMK